MSNIPMKTLTVDGRTYDVVDKDAVHFTAQVLTEAQKAQARANIGAASPENIITSGTDTLAWDDNTIAGSIVYGPDRPYRCSVLFVHISDIPLTKDDISQEEYMINLTTDVMDNGGIIHEMIYPKDSIDEFMPGFLDFGDSKVVSVQEEAVGKVIENGFGSDSEGCVFDKVGLYFRVEYISSEYEPMYIVSVTNSLTIPGYGKFGKKLSPEFLPSNVLTVNEQTLTQTQKDQVKANIGVDELEATLHELYNESPVTIKCEPQTLDVFQKAQARDNIGAVGVDEIGGLVNTEAVLYSPQTLSDEEKFQARINIEAIGALQYHVEAVKCTEQFLTDEEKAQARANIGAAAVGEGGDGSPDAVLYTEQTLTPEEQTQARANIGAASTEAVGDIESALDAIIAIQNEFIGGDSV